LKAILEKTININSDKTENIGTVRQFDSTKIEYNITGIYSYRKYQSIFGYEKI
jgi:hypothetical protein